MTPTPDVLARLRLLTGEEAQKMVAAWSSVPKNIRSERGLVRAWAELADVAEFRATALARRLRRLGICLPDRTVLPEALTVVGRDALLKLTPRPQRQR